MLQHTKVSGFLPESFRPKSRDGGVVPLSSPEDHLPPSRLPDAEGRNRPPNRYEVGAICPKTTVYRGGVVAPKSCTRASEHRFDRKWAIGAHKHPRHQDHFRRIFWWVYSNADSIADERTLPFARCHPCTLPSPHFVQKASAA